jgi:DNA transformation protein
MAQPKTHDDFVEHVVETMREFGAVTARQMFGGWGLYHDGAFFAIIVGDALYLKVDDDNRAEFEAAGLESFVYVTKDGDRIAMSYYQAPPEALESPAEMTAWARSGYAAALRAKAHKPIRRKT